MTEEGQAATAATGQCALIDQPQSRGHSQLGSSLEELFEHQIQPVEHLAIGKVTRHFLRFDL